jgi:ATP-dependent Clp protease adapter protein ClpS
MNEHHHSEPLHKPEETQRKRPATARPSPRPRQLPLYKVILHNDHVNEFQYVVRTVMELTRLSRLEAQQRTLEAHCTGLALLLVTHKERAELYVEQFASKGITVTTEAA